MKKKVEYNSYSINVTDEDLNPFIERVNKEIEFSFVASSMMSYSINYIEKMKTVQVDKTVKPDMELALVSESSLMKDWLKSEENEAWRDL